MPLTPLQALLGFAYLSRSLHAAVELLIASVAVMAAVALRRRKGPLSAGGLLMLGMGALIDLSARTIAPNQSVANVFAGTAVVLFLWGIIRILMNAAEYATRWAGREISSILRDLVGLILYAAIVIFVLG